MKMVAIDGCIVKNRTDMLHHSLYHGTGERDDAIPSYLASHRIGDDLSHPMKILVGGNPLHDFFKPCSSFVLSNRVKNVLSELPNITFLPVEFAHVVEMSVAAGDFTIPRQTLDLSWIRDFLRSMPDCPNLHPVDSYYELVVTNPYRSPDFENASFRVTTILPHLTTPAVEMLLSKKLLDDCPIFWSSKTVFRREVFDILDSMSLIDPDYFTWCEFEV